MATVTPNFDFPIPQSTDLVKDGATAIAALGTAIDTDFVDLKGGTTGQVLAKASNTDLDYTWVTQDDANAIQNAIVDAKGDLIAASAADTPARLAVGNNGETLVADSSATTGLRYTAGTVQSNPVLNSAFQIWQRGTSVAVTSGTFPYTADRWNYYPNGANNAQTVSRQATGDTTNLPNIQYCGRFQRNSGQTGTGAVYLCNSFETINSIPYVGKQVTFSFYARAGANYSSSGNGLYYRLYSGTGTDQLSNTGYTGATAVIGANATLTTTWQRFTATGTVGTSATELSIEFSHTPSGTAGANDYYEITGVQIDIGAVALPFRTNGSTLAEELAACQYYFEVCGSLYGYAFASDSIQGLIGHSPKRVTPSVGLLLTTPYGESPINVTARTGSGSTPAGSPNPNQYGSSLIRINGFTGMTAGTNAYISAGQITLSAEL